VTPPAPVSSSSHAKAAGLKNGGLRYLASGKGSDAMIRMPAMSKGHAYATGGRGWGKVKRLELGGQLLD